MLTQHDMIIFGCLKQATNNMGVYLLRKKKLVARKSVKLAFVWDQKYISIFVSAVIQVDEGVLECKNEIMEILLKLKFNIDHVSMSN